MEVYIKSVINQWGSYKSNAEKTFVQLTDDQLFWQANEESNSIATIVKHMHGNMLSRWTDFLVSDGEKAWRKRDDEFENDLTTRAGIMQLWEEGWACAINAIKDLKDADLDREIWIRGESHSVLDAIQRQLAHYPYHIGQIVFLGKLQVGNKWDSLSIPKGKSKEFNEKMKKK